MSAGILGDLVRRVRSYLNGFIVDPGIEHDEIATGVREIMRGDPKYTDPAFYRQHQAAARGAWLYAREIDAIDPTPKVDPKIHRSREWVGLNDSEAKEDQGNG